MKKYVLGFAYCPKFYLLIQKTHPDFQFGKLNGVGGLVESYESNASAMVREFKEEADIDTSFSQWREIGIIKGDNYEVIVYKTYLTEDQYKISDNKHDIVVSSSNLTRNPIQEKVYLVHEDAINYLNERDWLMYNVKAMINSVGFNNTFK